MARHTVHLSAGRAALLGLAVQHYLEGVREHRQHCPMSDRERAECLHIERALRDLLQFLPSVV